MSRRTAHPHGGKEGTAAVTGGPRRKAPARWVWRSKMLVDLAQLGTNQGVSGAIEETAIVFPIWKRWFEGSEIAR